MQDLRALVSDWSMIHIHLRGEIIEIPQHCIGFLLEGFVRAHGFQEELIVSPAALLPVHGNQSFGNAHGSQSIQNEEINGKLNSELEREKKKRRLNRTLSLFFYSLLLSFTMSNSYAILFYYWMEVVS